MAAHYLIRKVLCKDLIYRLIDVQTMGVLRILCTFPIRPSRQNYREKESEMGARRDVFHGLPYCCIHLTIT